MPRFKPTDQQRTEVETMSGYGISHEDIARLIISPRTNAAIDAKTLRVAFRAELDTGHVKANSSVVQSLFQQAVGGNVTAQIWWTKARMRWSETMKVAGSPGEPIRIEKIERTVVYPPDWDAEDTDGASPPAAVGGKNPQGR